MTAKQYSEHNSLELQQVIEDLQQHQFELQQQNEELRRTHSELNRATEKFRDLWNRAPIGYVSHNRSGLIETVNSRGRELLERVKPVQNDSSFLQAFLDEPSRQIFGQHMLSASQATGPVAADVRLDTPPDAAETWIRVESTLTDHCEYRTALIDVSARKQAEAERLAFAQQLQQAQKMDLLHNLSAGIAHDFNNILQIVLTYGEFLRDEFVTKGREATYVESLLMGARRGADLTRRLLAFCRQSSLQSKPADIMSIAANALEVIRRTVGDHILVTSGFSDEAVWASVDANLIEQALINLCVNARDAMPEGGRLLVDVYPEHLSKSLNVHGNELPAGDYATIIVADDGQGMSNEVAEKVFEPFFTTKATGSGTGLGLSIVYGIIRQHAGAISVDSAPGAGARFTIRLPRIEVSEATAIPTTPNSTTVAESRSGTILVAEDEPGIRDVLTQILASAGYTVHVAADGEEAIRMLDSESRSFDLLLTDAVMPRNSGKEVCQAFHARYPGRPVIILSGYGDGVIDRSFLDEHAAVLLNKPVHSDELLNAIAQCTDQAGRRTELS